MKIRLVVILAASGLAACHGGSGVRRDDSSVGTKPELRNALSARIEGTTKVQTSLVHALFDGYRQDVDEVLDHTWTPAFLDNLMSKPGVRATLARARQHAPRRASGSSPATAADLIPQAHEQIEQRRQALHAPLDELEAAMDARLDQQTRAMDAMNAALAADARGSLPTDLTQAGAPTPAVLEAETDAVTHAIAELRMQARQQHKLIDAWPKLVDGYRTRILAIRTQVGG